VPVARTARALDDTLAMARLLAGYDRSHTPEQRLGAEPFVVVREALGVCEQVVREQHGLAALETALHEHIHLENNILFPRALHQ